MKKYIALLLVVVTACTSCDRSKQAAKSAINKTGEVVGKGASELADGIAKGVSETFDCSVKVAEPLAKKGLSTGKFIVTDSSLVLYCIFDKDLKQTFMAKVFDPKGAEYGRSKVSISAKAGEARYVSFVFGEQSIIESKSEFVIESL